MPNITDAFKASMIQNIYLNIEEKTIIIYRTEKANGENIQFSYDSWSQGWIVGSKTVTILVRDQNDLDFYINNDKDEATKFSRYDYVIKFAENWFKVLNILKSKNLLAKFIKDVDGLTLVGENIDNNNQHIKLYNEDQIQFYSIVRNDSQVICENIEFTKAFFNKYGLKLVEVTMFCKTDSLNDFFGQMKKLYSMILKSNVDQEGEGNVVYFSSFDGSGSKEEVVSLAKLKTFEYKIYRALREKLKVYVAEYGKQNQSNITTILDKLQGHTRILKKLRKQARQFVKEETENIELNTYIKFCEFVLIHVKEVNMEIEFNKYATFIDTMKKKFCELFKDYDFSKYVVDENDDESLSEDDDEKKKNSDNEIVGYEHDFEKESEKKVEKSDKVYQKKANKNESITNKDKKKKEKKDEIKCENKIVITAVDDKEDYDESEEKPNQLANTKSSNKKIKKEDKKNKKKKIDDSDNEDCKELKEYYKEDNDNNAQIKIDNDDEDEENDPKHQENTKCSIKKNKQKDKKNKKKHKDEKDKEENDKNMVTTSNKSNNINNNSTNEKIEIKMDLSIEKEEKHNTLIKIDNDDEDEENDPKHQENTKCSIKKNKQKDKKNKKKQKDKEENDKNMVTTNKSNNINNNSTNEKIEIKMDISIEKEEKHNLGNDSIHNNYLH